MPDLSAIARCLLLSLTLGATLAHGQAPVLIPPPPLPVLPGESQAPAATGLPAPGAPQATTPAASRAARTRSSCVFSKASCTRQAPAEGVELALSSTLTGGAGCVVAVLTEASWVDFTMTQRGVQLSVAPNTTDKPRRTRVFVAGTNDGLSCDIEQAGR